MRHAICNEIFECWAFPAAAKAIRAASYEGIEIAPFTLAESPAKISVEERRQVRSIIDSEGLKFVGLHWLMVSPQGLHVTTPDRDLRERSWRHIRELIDLAALPRGFGAELRRLVERSAQVEPDWRNQQPDKKWDSPAPARDAGGRQ